MREYANKMYTVSTYYTAKVIQDTPILLVTPILYSLIVYFGIGLTITAGHFFYFLLILTLVVFSSASYGYMLSSLFSDMETAVELAPLVLIPIMLFGGLFTNSDSYPSWISWL